LALDVRSSAKVDQRVLVPSLPPEIQRALDEGVDLPVVVDVIAAAF